MARKCGKCGMNHQALGVTIAAGVLHRELDGSRHILRMMNGAIAFRSALLDGHKDELQLVEAVDRETGRRWCVDRRTFELKAVRMTLDLKAGEQLILPLTYWKDRESVNRSALSRPAAEEPVQQPFDFANRPGVLYWRSGRGERPRGSPGRRKTRTS